MKGRGRPAPAVHGRNGSGAAAAVPDSTAFAPPAPSGPVPAKAAPPRAARSTRISERGGDAMVRHPVAAAPAPAQKPDRLPPLLRDLPFAPSLHAHAPEAMVAKLPAALRGDMPVDAAAALAGSADAANIFALGKWFADAMAQKQPALEDPQFQAPPNRCPTLNSGGVEVQGPIGVVRGADVARRPGRAPADTLVRRNMQVDPNRLERAARRDRRAASADRPFWAAAFGCGRCAAARSAAE